MKQSLMQGGKLGVGHSSLLNSHFQTQYILPNTEYTTVCNPDFAPLICNEFVSTFLQQDSEGMGVSESKLDRREAIELTRHLCHWLAKEAMTCAVVETNQ